MFVNIPLFLVCTFMFMFLFVQLGVLVFNCVFISIYLPGNWNIVCNIEINSIPNSNTLCNHSYMADTTDSGFVVRG